MNKTLLFLLIINTLDLYTMENECLLCELTKQEAYEQRFPVIEKTEHWTVAINILSQLRGSVLLIPSRCIKSFADLLPAELETYRNLIIKYQDLLHQDTKLGAFNTGWQEDSHHIYVECAVRSPNDAGAIKALLQRSVATRNPRIFYRKMCELQNIPQEEIADRTSGETDSTTLPSFKFFDKRDKDCRQMQMPRMGIHTRRKCGLY